MIGVKQMSGRLAEEENMTKERNSTLKAEAMRAEEASSACWKSLKMFFASFLIHAILLVVLQSGISGIYESVRGQTREESSKPMQHFCLQINS